jgi:hypothetical protein
MPWSSQYILVSSGLLITLILSVLVWWTLSFLFPHQVSTLSHVYLLYIFILPVPTPAIIVRCRLQSVTSSSVALATLSGVCVPTSSKRQAADTFKSMSGKRVQNTLAGRGSVALNSTVPVCCSSWGLQVQKPGH